MIQNINTIAFAEPDVSSLEDCGKVLRKDDIELDTMRHAVTKAGKIIHLQKVDFTLLKFLMQNPEQVFSSETLLERVWQNAPSGTLDGLRMSVSRLRKALDLPDSSEKSIIETICRVGYRLRY